MKRLIKYLVLGSLMSCGAAATGDPLADAWVKFVAQDYAGAQQGFQDLVATQTSDAYAGLGWVAIRTDDLAQADVYFGLSISSGDSVSLVVAYTTAMAGWSFVGWQRGDYAQSIERADFVLRTVPDFIFQYDNNVTKNGLILTQAHDYFHLGDEVNCIERIQELDAAFNPSAVDPNITSILLNKLDALSTAAR